MLSALPNLFGRQHTSVEHITDTVIYPVLKTFLPMYSDVSVEIVSDGGLVDIVVERFGAGAPCQRPAEQGTRPRYALAWRRDAVNATSISVSVSVVIGVESAISPVFEATTPLSRNALCTPARSSVSSGERYELR